MSNDVYKISILPSGVSKRNLLTNAEHRRNRDKVTHFARKTPEIKILRELCLFATWKLLAPLSAAIRDTYRRIRISRACLREIEFIFLSPYFPFFETLPYVLRESTRGNLTVKPALHRQSRTLHISVGFVGIAYCRSRIDDYVILHAGNARS